MSKLLILGAGGRAGAAVVDEAQRRGHQVTAAVRTPEKYAGPPADVVAGDVTDPGTVARLAAGHDAVVAAVYDGGADPAEFFPRAARALVDGVGDARLVWIGLASLLPDATGTPLMDTAGYPQEYRGFYLAHQAAVDVFAASGLDWLSICPAGDFDHANPARTGEYRVVPGDAASLISYADLAVAVVDEIENPKHRHQLLGVERA